MMMEKVLALLWMSATLVTSTEVNDSNKTLTKIFTDYPSNITKLSLQHNLIVMNVSDTKALTFYPNLTELDLSYNRIAQLSLGAFHSLSSLDSLSLRGNFLKTVRNESFTGLRNLRRLDLGMNPWNCSCQFVSLMKWMNESGVQTEGPDAVCVTPNTLSGKSILNVSSACSSETTAEAVTSDTVTNTTSTTAATTTPPTTTTTATPPTTTIIAIPPTTATTASPPTTATTYPSTASPRAPIPATSRAFTSGSSANHISDKASSAAGSRSEGQEPAVSNTWKFLAGVVLIALCTSMLIVGAIKSPSWYKQLFNYRHQRLREDDEPSPFHAGRYSNFSLDTEQTETTAQELDQDPDATPPEDEDGFIEDGYIQPVDYDDTDEV